MSFAEYLRKDVRLVILRVLGEMPAYRANSSVLANMLDQFGHAVTRDQAKTELCWPVSYTHLFGGRCAGRFLWALLTSLPGWRTSRYCPF